MQRKKPKLCATTNVEILKEPVLVLNNSVIDWMSLKVGIAGAFCVLNKILLDSIILNCLQKAIHCLLNKQLCKPNNNICVGNGSLW